MVGNSGGENRESEEGKRGLCGIVLPNTGIEATLCMCIYFFMRVFVFERESEMCV